MSVQSDWIATVEALAPAYVALRTAPGLSADQLRSLHEITAMRLTSAGVGPFLGDAQVKNIGMSPGTGRAGAHTTTAEIFAAAVTRILP